jgi:hypothetical protein
MIKIKCLSGYAWRVPALAKSRCSSTVVLVLLGMTMPFLSALADELPDERFALAAGGYKVFRYNSSALLTDRGTGLGLGFSPEDVLGLESRQTIARLAASWRFRPRHSIGLAWYRLSSTNSLAIDREIDWIDEDGNPITIPVDARVSSRLDYEIVKLNYLWRFYQSDKVQLSAGAGLHMTDVGLELDAETTSSGRSARRGSTSIPLPVVSFDVNYSISPKLAWYLKAELFALSFDDWSGTYSDLLVGAEYRAWKPVGIGLALNSNSLRVVEEAPDTRFAFENRISGLLLYLRWYFQ